MLFDRNEYISELNDRLSTFPFAERKLKIGMEYGKLIRRFVEGKAFFEADHFLDAYYAVVHALHHLARIEVIDRGFIPKRQSGTRSVTLSRRYISYIPNLSRVTKVWRKGSNYYS